MDDAALYRLLAWTSPSYPVGAFAYSHGLEWAVEDGRVADEESLTQWVADVLELGGGWTDAVLFRHAHASVGAPDRVRDINDIAVALAPSEERHLETTAQGTAFLKTTVETWPWPGAVDLQSSLGPVVAYPVAVAVAAAGHGIDADMAGRAFLHGLAANLVSAGVRLIPLGQTSGQRTIARLEDRIEAVARASARAGIESLGGIAVISDIAAMRHETQYTRLFRS